MLGGAGCCPCPQPPTQDVPASPVPAGPPTRGAVGAGGAGDCRTGRVQKAGSMRASPEVGGGSSPASDAV